ncbi:MAG: YkgJ family cysteine cluster protein [Chloroflexi bacterium]|nr:YkgJ family cysteine cluster protein [Chloroflexota bacterium]
MTDTQGTPEPFPAMERGLRFAHVMMSVMQDQGNEAIAYVQALTDLLVEKGVLQADEIEAPLERAREEVGKVVVPRVRLADLGDKYESGENIIIDCASLIPLCQARCCTFRFFLTKQDLDEGIARWDYGNPYWIRQNDDGYCSHSHTPTRGCTIHANRPHVCRNYDCRKDKRVWLDFEKRIPAPMPELSGNAPVAMAEVALQNSRKNGNEPAASDVGFAPRDAS